MRRLFIIRVLLYFFSFLVFFNEYLIYILEVSFKWPTISCSNSNLCTKFLVIADPQILGELKENLFTRFDSDKFLTITFSLAYDHVKPDGLIFLGDLFDEGSQANNDQFERYYHRFRYIFQLERLYSSNIPVVFVAGDNDIGGEGNDDVSHETVLRFSKYFGNEDKSVIRSIQVLKVNNLLRTYSKSEDISSDNNITLNLAISHVPLTDLESPFTNKVIQDVKPDFILSGHEHKSYAVVSFQKDDEQLYYQALKQNIFRNGLPKWNFQAARSRNFTAVTQLIAPTCSYRMGQADVGYGVIVHDYVEPMEITYYMLWSPSRFTSLLLYVGMIFVIVFMVCLSWAPIQRKYRSRKWCGRFPFGFPIFISY